MERSEPLRADREGGARAVVRQAVPGRELQHFEFGSKKTGGIGDRAHRTRIGRDEHRPARCGARQIAHHQRLRTARDSSQRQRLGSVQDAGKIGHGLKLKGAHEGRFPSARNLDEIEALHGIHLRSCEAIGNDGRFQHPCHDVDIVFLEQGFEPGEFRRAPALSIAIEEPAESVIRFARAAVPGAEFRFRETLGKVGFGGHEEAVRGGLAPIQLVIASEAKQSRPAKRQLWIGARLRRSQ